MDRARPTRAGTAAAILAIAVALTACMPRAVVPGRPALRQAAVSPTVWDSSDPGVLVSGGKTYLFGSSNNVLLPVRELTSFTGSFDASRAAWGSGARNALSRLPVWFDQSRAQVWAPSPVKIGSRFYVYFAGHRNGATDRGNDQCIGRASAASPMGPYVPESAPLYCGLSPEPGSNRWGRGALDPEVFRGPTGSLFMLVALSRTTANIGAVRLTADGRVIGGLNATPSTLASQRFGWQDGVDDGHLGPTFLENPSMAYDTATRTYLLFYSAGDWRTSRYVTGFGRCSTPLGPCALDSRGPFLKAGAGRSGVGGLTAFRGPDGVLRAAYASWRQGGESVPSSDGTLSRHTSLARIVTSGKGVTVQTVALTHS